MPTHTPAATAGENPTKRASLKSFVVPVLPATGMLSRLCLFSRFFLQDHALEHVHHDGRLGFSHHGSNDRSGPPAAAALSLFENIGDTKRRDMDYRHWEKRQRRPVISSRVLLAVHLKR